MIRKVGRGAVEGEGGEGLALTVFLSNYNHGKYLDESIGAIVSQSRQPDEFLILDDGSTDNSVEIIERYAREHSFVTFLRHEERKGFMAAVNFLVRKARGDYVYGAAADDYVLPGFFEKLMAMAERHPEAGILFGKMRAIDEKGRILYVAEASRWKEPLFASPEKYLREYLDFELPHHSQCGATIFRRKAFEEVGWYKDSLGHSADTFAVNTVALKYGACYVPEEFTAWRVLQGSVSMAGRKNLSQSMKILRKTSSLMRSPDFRDLYPEKHVRRWERRCRDRIIAGYFLQKIKDIARYLSRW